MPVRFKQRDHALDATRYALHTEFGEHAATEAYLAEMQRYVKTRARPDGNEDDEEEGAA